MWIVTADMPIIVRNCTSDTEVIQNIYRLEIVKFKSNKQNKTNYSMQAIIGKTAFEFKYWFVISTGTFGENCKYLFYQSTIHRSGRTTTQ